MKLILLILILSLLVNISCFSSLAPSQVEIAKVFQRLADKKILLDVEGAGTPAMTQCCHGGCDNCEFSRIFDEMNSARSKWVPAYPTRRLIDDRSHTSSWFKSLFLEKDEVSREQFVARLLELEPQMVMGPPPSTPKDPLENVTADIFFTALAGGHDTHTLKAMQMEAELVRRLGTTHGGTWVDFKNFFCVE